MKISRPISSKYKYRTDNLFGANPKTYKKFGMKGHNGLDYPAPRGVSVYAVERGTVAYSYNNKDGYGEVIKLNHKWGQSIYGHLQSRYVLKGHRVKRCQKIGTVDNTGYSSGNHLHFGIRINPINYGNGYYGWIDPLSFFKEENKMKHVKDYPKQSRGILAYLQPKNWKRKWNVIKRNNWTIPHYVDWLSRTVVIEKRRDINKLKKQIIEINKNIANLTKENKKLKNDYFSTIQDVKNWKDKYQELKQKKIGEMSEEQASLIAGAIIKKLGRMLNKVVKIFISTNPGSDEKKK